ncbi:glycosyltransferase [Wenzhouxiangella marina]|uniref:Glycosyltransferase subfamily 4-like N-terminal domain-containing protein n=1 Tax=Wenzhouxiangella marina TaxID=1579979 RepID=A0A0K0XYK5_9GAMM|nr:glycosyltransferase [Wenzhouxiangella marina]AKS42755.1 hypothetical protein WM2015_2393 [Wenzhouxiangella marina]MBB6087569.1 glycosyltransferase involved in cell wall biosynthesis [Wenzhouxiangella marina]
MTTTLYLTRNGLLEPLGQSQVFSYLRGLSDEFRITLMTSEKAGDWADAARMMAAREICVEHSINWLPRRFRSGPKLLAPVLSVLGMAWRAWRRVRRDNVGLVHARSYLPAAVAWVVWRLTGTPFIFDMRALWPEEMITAGRLRRGSLVHKAILRIERVCLRDAAAVVSLTKSAVDYLRQQYPTELENQRIEVIPTCADLQRFNLSSKAKSGSRVHGCVGTVLSGWFRLDWLAAWVHAVALYDENATFEIVTRDDPWRVRQALDPDGTLSERLQIGPRLPEEMPTVVSNHDVSVMFFTSGLSKLGSCPTRLAEVLASGIPVVANEGVGDVGKIISENRVGVLLKSGDPLQIASSIEELELLLKDPELSKRCRETAERFFSLKWGAARYAELYRQITADHSPR